MIEKTPKPSYFVAKRNGSIVIGVKTGEFRINFEEAQFLAEHIPLLLRGLSADWKNDGLQEAGSETYCL